MSAHRSTLQVHSRSRISSFTGGYSQENSGNYSDFFFFFLGRRAPVVPRAILPRFVFRSPLPMAWFSLRNRSADQGLPNFWYIEAIRVVK